MHVAHVTDSVFAKCRTDELLVCEIVTSSTSTIRQQWCTINMIWVNRNKTLRESELSGVENVISIPHLLSL
jgi:hypothetical protein